MFSDQEWIDDMVKETFQSPASLKCEDEEAKDDFIIASFTPSPPKI